MDTLIFARDVWREFNLNDSEGAAMQLTENGIVTKSHGRMANTDILKEMPIMYDIKPAIEKRKFLINEAKG
jgi:hypothetical protein